MKWSWQPWPRRALAVSGAGLAALLAGCAGEAGTYAAENRAPSSPIAPVAAHMAARTVKYQTPGSEVSTGTGTSMMPLYGENTILVIAPVAWEDLQPDMEVAFRDPEGDSVVHTLLRKEGDHWIAKGFNNRQADATPVTRENLIGVVYGTFRSQAPGE